jgi:hypothetical protein
MAMAGRIMGDDICYEIQVQKHGNWVRFGTAGSPEQAEHDARTALQERKYLEAYKIVCERRDTRTGKVNKIAFPPVPRDQLDAVADHQWERHLQGKPAVDPPQRRRWVPRRFSWLLPVLFLILIVWGAFFTLEYVQSQLFAK